MVEPSPLQFQNIHLASEKLMFALIHIFFLLSGGGGQLYLYPASLIKTISSIYTVVLFMYSEIRKAPSVGANTDCTMPNERDAPLFARRFFALSSEHSSGSPERNNPRNDFLRKQIAQSNETLFSKPTDIIGTYSESELLHQVDTPKEGQI